jgi:hypothetical protein
MQYTNFTVRTVRIPLIPISDKMKQQQERAKLAASVAGTELISPKGEKEYDQRVLAWRQKLVDGYARSRHIVWATGEEDDEEDEEEEEEVEDDNMPVTNNNNKEYAGTSGISAEKQEDRQRQGGLQQQHKSPKKGNFVRSKSAQVPTNCSAPASLSQHDIAWILVCFIYFPVFFFFSLFFFVFICFYLFLFVLFFCVCVFAQNLDKTGRSIMHSFFSTQPLPQYT